jgi:hypothetical protein
MSLLFKLCHVASEVTLNVSEFACLITAAVQRKGTNKKKGQSCLETRVLLRQEDVL